MNKKCPNCNSKGFIYVTGGKNRCTKCGHEFPLIKKNGFFKRIVTKVWEAR